MSDTLQRSSLLKALIDPAAPTAHKADGDHAFTGGTRGVLILTLIGIALLSVSLVVGFSESFREQFYFSYLIGWTFCLSLALGSLFVVMIKHLVRAHWIVALRRIPESAAASFPLLAILFIPILIGLFDSHGPYHHWAVEGIADPADSHYDEILAGKVAYLNRPFFLVRIAIYFILWTFIAGRLWWLSLLQDATRDAGISARQRHLSAWGIPITGITTSFASFDILMSLDPHWFSTIFGVYFFSGSFMAAFAFTALCLMILQRGGMLKGVVTAEHYHDLGKLMFGFVVFWAYIAFSQYMLYWYGGIPEETVWFKHRLEHGWETHSAILLVGHFILPFVLMLPRAVKRNTLLLGIMAVWLLAMQWFDHHWLAMPVLHGDHAMLHWLDIVCWAALVCVFCGAMFWRLSRHSIVCSGDPQLGQSLRFENI